MATIIDIAREAGVGVGTVSRVINGRDRVSPETRQRVQAVIDRMDYAPNPSAQSLSTGRSSAISVILPFISSPSVTARIGGVVDALGNTDREMIVHIVESAEQRKKALRTITSGVKPAGVVVISLPLEAEDVQRFKGLGIPVVAVDVALDGVPSITVDDVAGGYLATSYLIEQGHREIAFLGDVDDQGLGFRSSVNRQRGYSQALTDHGIQSRAELIRTGPFGRVTAHEMTRDLLALSNRPTAVFAASDVQAFGVLEALSAHGLSVPDDMSVMGFDDIEMAPFLGLTSVRQPLVESGKIGASTLLSALDGGPADNVELALTVVERSTVARKADSRDI